MTSTELYSSPTITVSHDANHGIIHHTIHQPITNADVPEFKEALNAGTEALEKHGLSKWLSDDRNNGPLPEEIIQWAEEDWYQRTIDKGWKYWANVVPASLIAASTLTPVMNVLHTMGLRMQVFSNLEDALAWLDSLD